MADQLINIKNRRAYFDFEISDTFEAGIQLTGTEIKSIRGGRANIGDAYCFFKKGELWVKNMHIDEYELGTHYNHEPLRTRKLLMNKRELKKLESKATAKGFTIIALRCFVSERGFAKLEIGLAKGKKSHDKRHSIKDKENKRDLDRIMKGRR